MSDRTVSVRLVLRAQQFSPGLNAAAADTERFAVRVSRSTQNAASSALAMGAASATAGKLIVLGIGGAMAVSAKAAIDFESSLTKVAKTTGMAGTVFGAQETPLSRFGDALRSLSLRIPINVNELARIAEIGGQLGIETPNLIRFTETIAAMGVATNLSTEEAADGMASFINIMGTGEDQFERVGSIIVQLGNDFQASESQILKFGLRIAPVGRTVGMTEAGVLALATALSSLGIPAERGGTAVQRVMLLMEQSVETGSEKLRAFAETADMSMEDFQALFRRAPEEGFFEFVRGLERVQEEGGSAFGVLKRLDIQEQRTIQVLLASANGWDLVRDAIDGANQETIQVDALQEEAARAYGTTASQLQLLGNSFNDLKIEIGGAVLGSGGLAAAIDIFRDFFLIVKDNLPLLGRIASALGLLAGLRFAIGIGAGIANMGSFISKIKGGDAAIRGMSGAMRGLRITALAVNAAIGLVTLGVGIAMAVWVNAAIRASELRAKLAELRSELEAGVSQTDALVTLFNEGGRRGGLFGLGGDAPIFTEKVARAMFRLGVSQEDFVNGLAQGRDVLAEMTGQATGTREQIQALYDMGQYERGSTPWTLISQDITQYMDALAHARQVWGGFESEIVRNFRNAALEAGVSRSIDQIDRAARSALKTFGIDFTSTQFVQMLTGTGPIFGDERRRTTLNAVSTDLENATGNWRNTLATMQEGREDLEDDFFQAIAKDADDFVEDWNTAFMEVKTSFFENFPTADDYEQMAALTRTGLNKIIAAQDRYLLDMQSWSNLHSFLRQNASAEAVAFFEGLSPEEQGGFGRLFEDNYARFNDFLYRLQLNINEANELVKEEWLALEPGFLQQRFAETFGVVLGEIPEEMKGFPRAFMGMLTEGLTERMMSMPQEVQDDFVVFLEEMFGSDIFLAQFGLEKGDAVVSGFLAALAKLAGLTITIPSTVWELPETRPVAPPKGVGTDVRMPGTGPTQSGIRSMRGMGTKTDAIGKSYPVTVNSGTTTNRYSMDVNIRIDGSSGNPREISRRVVEEMSKRLYRYGAERKI